MSGTFQDVAVAGAEAAVTIGIVEAALNEDAPDEVKENFEEKVGELVAHIRRETAEFVDFGESYDHG